MRTTYRVLADLVALGVVVQAAAIAFAVFGLGKYIDDGGVVDKASQESDSAGFVGVIGFAVHGIAGQMVIPAIAILLLVASFFAKVPRGVLWAGVVVLVVAIQVALGIFGGAIPELGILHGVNALVLFAVAMAAAKAAATRSASPAATADRVGVE